jgi:hypothetical protein
LAGVPAAGFAARFAAELASDFSTGAGLEASATDFVRERFGIGIDALF